MTTGKLDSNRFHTFNVEKLTNTDDGLVPLMNPILSFLPTPPIQRLKERQIVRPRPNKLRIGLEKNKRIYV